MADRPEHGEISPMEARVLELASLRNTNGQIGRRLAIREGTVKTHMRRLLSKLGASDRTHAVRIGIERGLLDLTPADRRGSLIAATSRDPFQDTHWAVCFAAEACPCRARYREPAP